MSGSEEQKEGGAAVIYRRSRGIRRLRPRPIH